MLGQFLLYNKMNQLYEYIYPHISSLFSLPPTLPISSLQVITRAPSLSPCTMQQFPISHPFYIWQCIYVNATLSLHLHLPFSHCVLKSILYVCVFIPALPLGSSVPLFQIPYICVKIRCSFFFLTYFTLYDSLWVHAPHYK